VFLASLAFDFCVRYSADDARHCGFEVVVIEDARRGIDMGGFVATTQAALSSLGVLCICEAAIG
jgi:nicotinamidase/pyrazinamidase